VDHARVAFTNEHFMNRRSFLIVGAASLVSPSLKTAHAARPQTCRLTVNVLSVDRKSATTSRNADGSLLGTASFVAKARVQQVLQNDLDVKSGDVIQIRYDVFDVLQPSEQPGTRRTGFTVGQTATLIVLRGGPVPEGGRLFELQGAFSSNGRLPFE
jgi:hypothetical protein